MLEIIFKNDYNLIVQESNLFFWRKIDYFYFELMVYFQDPSNSNTSGNNKLKMNGFNLIFLDILQNKFDQQTKIKKLQREGQNFESEALQIYSGYQEVLDSIQEFIEANESINSGEKNILLQMQETLKNDQENFLISFKIQN